MKMIEDQNLKCPCGSGLIYVDCCKIYHDGGLPLNALALMRSRYTAYFFHLADYIIETTHPQNPNFHPDKDLWKKEILYFSKNTQFEGLKINKFEEKDMEAFVTFTAYLKQSGRDCTFTERSQFEKVNGRWLYRDAMWK